MGGWTTDMSATTLYRKNICSCNFSPHIRKEIKINYIYSPKKTLQNNSGKSDLHGKENTIKKRSFFFLPFPLRQILSEKK